MPLRCSCRERCAAASAVDRLQLLDLPSLRYAVGLLFPPPSVEIIAVEKSMEIYSWGRKSLRFHRCARCECVTHYLRSLGQASARIGVNARMFEPEVVASVRIRHLDGAASWKYLD